MLKWSAQITGGIFLALGIMSILTADVLLGGVWALLGVSILLSNPYRGEPPSRRSPRVIAATVALALALVLLVIDFV
ncbi:hypothetical protein [Aggregatilinea lenta]|uniref:hypothetical protein n=1 Tax=Aggregatilinea lenta TaxID=913108 RepID=UPI000E5B0D01|nr:hypothetical protein [Aggregatilinea lenta]